MPSINVICKVMKDYLRLDCTKCLISYYYVLNNVSNMVYFIDNNIAALGQ